jgi:aryl-alcohol dehydrogenase-like predicted oxidoreductase
MQGTSPEEPAVKQRRLGASNILVGEIGYGAMGLSWAYAQPVDERDGIDLIRRAVELGVTLFDTSDVYGPFTNERLVGKALAGRRERVTVATKCGLIVRDRETFDFDRDASPAYIKAACDASLARLGIDVIDLYQLHRVDPKTPVEESVGAMAELVQAGKVRAIGLSEVDVETLERASRVHPIATLQSELSLFERGTLATILPWCAAHDVAFLPFSPLGRGFLTGRLKQGDIAPDDFRATLPRFEGDAFERNLAIVDTIAAVANRLGVTNGQVALAWVLAQGEMVVPIPGTKRLAYLEENVGAADVELAPADLAELNAAWAPVGARYSA